MTQDYVLKFLVFFFVFYYAKSYNVQDSTVKDQLSKFTYLIFGHSVPKIYYNNQGNVCLNDSSNTLHTGFRSAIPRTRKTRENREKYQLLVSSSRPLLMRIGPSILPPLKGRLNTNVPPSPVQIPYHATPKIGKPIIIYNDNIRRNTTSSLIISKNSQTGQGQGLNNSKLSTTTQSLMIGNQKRDNSARQNVLQENEGDNIVKAFSKPWEMFERLLYQASFKNLLSISPADHQENGISFIQSSLFLYLALMAISLGVDEPTKLEIENCLRFEESNMKKHKEHLKSILSWLPVSNSNFKFQWTSRLVINSEMFVSQRLIDNVSTAGLHVTRLNSTDASVINKILNYMVENDSGGAMRDTFEEEELVDVCSVLMTTVYFRARWRSAPTLLNGTRPFHDTNELPQRSVRMIRINDVMQYAALDVWNADAIEITYATPGLTLLLLVPRGNSIKTLAKIMTNNSIQDVTNSMRTMRVAVSLPIYTLRMTLLLPRKLQAKSIHISQMSIGESDHFTSVGTSMGISRLIETNHFNRCEGIKLSHAVQRLMFWAEAGNNAFKDDGIEWDEAPEIEFVVNRPYLFYVRWKNITLMNGNFVL